jgi:hypothetical protein
MIIYGEALPEDSRILVKPARDGGVRLDDAAPEAAKVILDRALQGVTLREQ